MEFKSVPEGAEIKEEPKLRTQPFEEPMDEERKQYYAEIERNLKKQSLKRIAARGKSVVIKNGKRGRVIGTWMSEETLAILGELSIAWEMSRTKVITQLVRQAKGTTLTQYYGPAPGEEEVSAEFEKEMK